MMKRFELALLWILLALTPAGCSVLEERSSCPCYLDIDYGVVRAGGWGRFPGAVVCVSAQAPDSVWRAEHPLASCPETEEITVHRDSVRVIALLRSGQLSPLQSIGGQITCSPDCQIDSLYAFSETVDCTGEETRVVLVPHKQFSTLSFEDGEGGSLLRQYDLVVQGTTCGFLLTDLSAVEGPYVVRVEEVPGSGCFPVRIPRQLRPDLVLMFRSRVNPLDRFRCPVGRCLFEAGYDPAAADLPDYDFRIDLQNALLGIRVRGWEDEFIYSLYP